MTLGKPIGVLVVSGAVLVLAVSGWQIWLSKLFTPRTTVRITLGGLVTFVPDPSANVLRVALPDARDGETVERCPSGGGSSQGSNCTPATIKLPKHAAMIVFDRSDPGSTIPGNVPWILDDEEVEISLNPVPSPTASSSTGPLDRLGNLKAIQPGIGNINPMIQSSSINGGLANFLVARLRLSGGQLKFHSEAGTAAPIDFRALQGNAQVPSPNAGPIALELEYVIEGDSVRFTRKRFSDQGEIGHRDLAGGEFQVFIGNLPIENDGGASGDIFPGLVADTHFYWYYNLAANPPAPTARLVPVFPSGGGPVTITGPRCMMAYFQTE